MGVGNQLKHAWNAFFNVEEEFTTYSSDMGASYATRPDRVRLFYSNERSTINAILTRIAIDVASVDIRHVRLDEKNRYKEDIESGLNNCLNVEANLDQAASFFKQDSVMTMLDKGTVAVVPVDTNLSPATTGGYDILTMRVATHIQQWWPQHIRVNLYNDKTGREELVTIEKKNVAIVENPLYSVMNEPNSTLQRLIRKLNLLDSVDEQSSSGKLDMIIQLPYVVKSDQRRQQADQRRKDIEFQLRGSKYGIAYTDGTEKITQLNRPVDNNLLQQIKDLKEQLYAELGITAGVMNGTASEAEMLNYNNRTIEPIIRAFAEEYKRKFLTKTARTQKQSIEYFRDPFKLVPMKDLAEMADKFTRNEIVTSNEFRGFMGIPPSQDPKADKLQNSNMPAPEEVTSNTVEEEVDDETDDIMNSAFDEIDGQIDQVFRDLGEDPDAT